MDQYHTIFAHNLKCKICSKYPRSDVWQCSSGHLICKTCYNCTIERTCIFSDCRAIIFNVWINCVTNLVQSLSVKCAQPNCVESVKLLDLDNHFGVCEYRDIKCHFFPEVCNKPHTSAVYVHWNTFCEHLMTKHSASKSIVDVEAWSPIIVREFWTGVPTSANVSPRFGNVEIMEFQGVPFFVTTVAEEDTVFLNVSALLPDTEANKFKVTVFVSKHIAVGNIEGGHYNQQKITVSGVRGKFDEIKYSEYCAIYPLRMLLKCSEQCAMTGTWKTYFKVNFCPNN